MVSVSVSFLLITHSRYVMTPKIRESPQNSGVVP